MCLQIVRTSDLIILISLEMLRASASRIKFHSVHSNPIDYPTTSNTNSPNASHPHFKHNTRYHPLSFTLKVDQVNILLDAGCPLTFMDSHQWLSAYARFIDSVDGVLLSGPEIVTCGAVPFLKKLRPSLDIVAMGSTAKMGRITVISTFQALFGNEKTFSYTDPSTKALTTLTITTEEVYRAFQSIREPSDFNKALFSPTSLDGKRGPLNSVDESPEDKQVVEARATHNGQCLGGYIWALTYQTDEITYAPSFSTKPSTYLKTLTRTSMEGPSHCNILLTDATAASIPAPASITNKEPVAKGTKASAFPEIDAFTAAVEEGLHDNHDVIVPVDATIKGIEVLSALDKFFEARALSYLLVFVFPHAEEVLETVRVTTDSLNDADTTMFRNVRCKKTVAEAADLPSPKVLVVDGADLDYGLAIELLARMSKPWTMCFTHYPAPWTNAGRLYAKFHPQLALQGANAEDGIASGVVSQYVSDSQKIGAVGSSTANIFNRGRVFNASSAATSNTPQTTIALTFTKRTEFTREEKELYMAKKEAEKRAQMEGAAEDENVEMLGGGERIVEDIEEVSDAEDDEVAGAAIAPKAKAQHTPGLFLPHHLSSFNTAHLLFPKVTNITSASSSAYGLPLQEWERHIFAVKGHTHNHIDLGPTHKGDLHNDLLEHAKMPAHITLEADRQLTLSGCRVATVDLSNLLDIRGYLRFLKGFPSAKKVVFLKGSTVDTQKHVVTPLQVEQRSRAALVSASALFSRRESSTAKGSSAALPSVQFFLQNSHAGKGVLELATIVTAFDVRLAPTLASIVQRSLCKVQERALGHGAGLDGDEFVNTSQRGTWEIGWLHGYVAPPPTVPALVPDRNNEEGIETPSPSDIPEKKKRIEFVEGDKLVTRGVPTKLTEEEKEQADVAALFAEEEGQRGHHDQEGNDDKNVGGRRNTTSAVASSEAASAAQSSPSIEKAAAIKTLYPIPPSLGAQALLHMEQEGIVQGSVFVGGLSLTTVRDHARDLHRSIAASMTNRASASTAPSAAGTHRANNTLLGEGMSTMGGEAGTDLAKYRSLISAITVSTPDGSEALSAELLTGSHEALVLGYDTIVRQQGGIRGGGGDEAMGASIGNTSILGDVAVEGVVSPNFFAVRELVYSQFARIL